NGKVSFSLLPSLAVEADDVALSNPPGAASPNMATFAKLQLQLKLLPLLSHRVEVDKQGRPNWQFSTVTQPKSPAAPKPAAPAPAAAQGGGGMLSGLSLADVR